MLGDLPKLFDRNFAISYLVPLILYGAASFVVLQLTGLFPVFFHRSLLQFLSDTTVLAILTVIAVIFSVILLMINRELYRIMEGYNRWNPARLMSGAEKHRYRTLKEAIQKADDEYNDFLSRGDELPAELLARRDRLYQKLAEEFPEREDRLLPTPFGNAIRAFEDYPRLMYGFDAIDGWNRLLLVIPKEQRDGIDGARAQTDFWINLWFLNFLFIIECCVIAIIAEQNKAYLYLFIPICIVFLPAIGFMAKITAIEWGDSTKALFDIFLPRLYTELHYPNSGPASVSEERKYWEQFSQAILYRLPDALPRKAQVESENHENRKNEEKQRLFTGKRPALLVSLLLSLYCMLLLFPKLRHATRNNLLRLVNFLWER